MLSDKLIKEYKDIFEVKYKRKISDEEAREGAQNLTNLFEIFYQQFQTEQRRKAKLKDNPDGFLLDDHEGAYNCRVCNYPVSGKEAWWDLNGVKCLDCQRNIKEGVIPGEICQNDDLCIKEWQLQSDYSLHPSTRRKLIREGVLKARDLKREDGSTYYSVYLVSENKEFFKKYPQKPKMKFEWKTVDSKGNEVRP